MYQPEWKLAKLLRIKKPVDRLEFEIKLRYFLNKNDPTIDSIIKYYPKLVKKIKSLNLDYDNDRVIITTKELCKLFDLNSLISQGYNPNYLKYDVFCDYVLTRFCTTI